MTWLESITELVRVLVWPAVVMFALWRFGQPLAQLLNRLRSLEAPSVKGTFDSAAKAAEQAAAELPPQPTAPQRPARPRRAVHADRPVAAEPITLDGLRGLVSDAPNLEVIHAWGLVEGAAQQAASKLGAPDDQPAMAIIIAAALQGTIPRDLMRVADDLIELRNRVVHSDTDITPTGATSYVNAASRLVSALNSVT